MLYQDAFHSNSIISDHINALNQHDQETLRQYTIFDLSLT